MFETAPFSHCPLCETADAFGILHIGDQSVSRRCRKCQFSKQEKLPPLNKKVIYLDQFAFSELFKLEAGLRREDAPSGEFWSNLSAAVRRVLLLQQAVFPASDIHSGETLVAKEHKLLKEALHRIGGDANFIDTRDVESLQNWACFDAYCHKCEPVFDLSVKNVLRRDENKWLPAMRIVVNTDYSIFADNFRNSVDDTADDFAGLVQHWRHEKPSFEQVLNDELNSFGAAKRRAWLMQTAKLAVELRPDDSMEWLDAAMHPVMREYSSLRRAFERRGLKDDEASDEVFRFWDWSGNLSQPYHQIGSFLFAAIARKIVAGQKKPPTRGFMNDVRAIAAYAPYVDAMFLDRECAGLLNEEPLKSLSHINAKIFSTNNAEEFLAYLADIEDHAPSDVTQIAKSLYRLA